MKKNDIIAEKKKNTFGRDSVICLPYVLIFILLLVLSRVLDLYSYKVDSNVLYTDSYKLMTGISYAVASLLVTAFAASSVIRLAESQHKHTAVTCAAMMSLCFAVSRALYVFYNVNNNVISFSGEVMKQSIIRVTIELVSFVASFFFAALYSHSLWQRCSDGGKINKGNYAYRASLAFCVLLTLFKIADQTYYTVSQVGFPFSVDTESALLIAGDYLFVILRYGIVMFGAVLLFYKIMNIVSARRLSKKQEEALHKKS